MNCLTKINILEIQEKNGFKTLVSTSDIPPRTVIHTLGGTLGFERDRHTIQLDLDCSLFVLSFLCLLISILCTSVFFVGLSMVCFFGGIFKTKIHLDDPLFRYCNHSFSPNTHIKGRKVICIKPIKKGEPITFNYYTTESKIVEGFIDSETTTEVD